MTMLKEAFWTFDVLMIGRLSMIDVGRRNLNWCCGAFDGSNVFDLDLETGMGMSLRMKDFEMLKKYVQGLLISTICILQVYIDGSRAVVV